MILPIGQVSRENIIHPHIFVISSKVVIRWYTLSLQLSCDVQLNILIWYLINFFVIMWFYYYVILGDYSTSFIPNWLAKKQKFFKVNFRTLCTVLSPVFLFTYSCTVFYLFSNRENRLSRYEFSSEIESNLSTQMKVKMCILVNVEVSEIDWIILAYFFLMTESFRGLPSISRSRNWCWKEKKGGKPLQVWKTRLIFDLTNINVDVTQLHRCEWHTQKHVMKKKSFCRCILFVQNCHLLVLAFYIVYRFKTNLFSAKVNFFLLHFRQHLCATSALKFACNRSRPSVHFTIRTPYCTECK